MWKLERGDECCEFGVQFFLIKLVTTKDKEVVLRDRHWTVLGHYLLVREFMLNFDLLEARNDKAIVWVHVPLYFLQNMMLTKSFGG